MFKPDSEFQNTHMDDNDILQRKESHILQQNGLWSGMTKRLTPFAKSCSGRTTFVIDVWGKVIYTKYSKY